MGHSIVRFRTGLVLGLAMAWGAAIVAAQTPQIAGPNAPAAQNLPPQQLENLVAPVALYPDPLLGQVLAASTYPVELMEAQQWLQANGNLRGQQLMDAARQQNWDASVQALVAMPDVLATLTQDVRWTTDLGNAFLAQQGDVMSAVQQMRERAQANGQLQSNPQETVTTENQGGQQAIEIQPANPQEIYVPAYDPYYVYGWGAYPPLAYPDGYWFEPGIDVGLYFGGWGGWGFGGLGWGWGTNWFGGGLFVNAGFFNHYGFRYGYGFGGGWQGRTAWMHDPAHRLGAAYSNSQVNGRFGAASQASRMAAGRAGAWHSFSGNNAVGANSFRGGASQPGVPQAGARGAQSFQGSQSYRSQGSAERYSAPAQQRYAASVQRSTPGYQAPQRSFQSAPRSAPSYGGGSSHSSGGSHSNGGGGHGGGRR